MAQILATGSQRAAKTSRIITDGETLAFASWNARVEGEDLPTENFTSWDATAEQAYNEGILGFLGCTGDFGGDWDASMNPIDYTAQTPPGLYPRDDLPQTFFYTSIVDDVYFQFPYLRIRTSEVGANVKELVTFSCGYMNQGPFDFPTGSV